MKIKQNLPQIPAIIADKAISGDQDCKPIDWPDHRTYTNIPTHGMAKKIEGGGGKIEDLKKVATAKVVAIEFA